MPSIVLFSAVVVVCASLQLAPASAAPSCTSVLPALNQEVTCTYNAGGTTDITVPEGAAFMAIELQAGGGGGGGGSNPGTGASGGAGARVSTTLNVVGISTVRALVGVGGGGGAGRAVFFKYDGGGGGGFTAIYAGASTAPVDVLAVAGGGGGGGGSASGVSIKTGGAGAASNTAAGGNGISPGFGALGDGSGGTGSSGANGATWDAGGSGGTGADIDSGKGGAGYGGGEEGDLGDGTVNGGGGGGGSYVRPALLVGSAVYAPTGGAGGIGVFDNNGANGANGSLTITFSAAPITPSAGTSTSPSFVNFTYLLTDGRECTSISPQRVQVGTFVELPGEDALCKMKDGSIVAGWTIPVPPGFTGAGSSSLPFTPGHKVRVIESQRFTVVPFDLVITVEYDANIAADDACMPATMAFTTDNGRTGMAWVPRVDFAIARTWSAAPCVPGGYELTGWNTAGGGSGESIGLGAPLPESWMLSRTNERRLYAMWKVK